MAVIVKAVEKVFQNLYDYQFKKFNEGSDVNTQ